MSEATAAVLRRVGQVMRPQTGTGPENDPFLRAERAESRDEGRVEGRIDTLHELLRDIFQKRRLVASARLGALVRESVDLPANVLMDAAYACRDEADFRRRVESVRG